MKFVEICRLMAISNSEEDQKFEYIRNEITNLSVATKDFIMNGETGECIEKSDLDKAFEVLDFIYIALHNDCLEIQ